MRHPTHTSASVRSWKTGPSPVAPQRTAWRDVGTTSGHEKSQGCQLSRRRPMKVPPNHSRSARKLAQSDDRWGWSRVDSSACDSPRARRRCHPVQPVRRRTRSIGHAAARIAWWIGAQAVAMSAWGPSRRFRHVGDMSGLPQTTDFLDPVGTSHLCHKRSFGRRSKSNRDQLLD